MEVFQDGSIYADRDDVVNFSVIQVDQTVHYIGPNGDVKGSARVPLSEFRYPPDRNKAIGPDGEVYVLLPRPDSIDIVRLKFYTQLEPLKPGAEIPHIYRK